MQLYTVSKVLPLNIVLDYILDLYLLPRDLTYTYHDLLASWNIVEPRYKRAPITQACKCHMFQQICHERLSVLCVNLICSVVL